MMTSQEEILNVLKTHQNRFHPVVQHTGSIGMVNLSPANPYFSEHVYNDINRFIAFIDEERKIKKAEFLIGGYAEQRQMYRRSTLFDAAEEPRSLHLGIDIWGNAGTGVHAPLGGIVHGFAYNNNFGDYGSTIILQHQLDTINFYTLYGHLSLADLDKRKGQFITRGEKFAHFGDVAENGGWPPHLHFQLIMDIGLSEGDYPGVCKMSEAGKYLANSPDPAFLLNWAKR